MFSLMRISSWAIGLLIVAGFLPADARAETFGTKSKKEDYSHSERVSDNELSKMRGGAFNINGVLIDFSFLSIVQVGREVQSDVSFDTANLVQAAMAAQQVQDLLQPQIIQNVDSGTLISIQQAVSLDILNAAQLGAIAQLNNFAYQQTVAGQ